MLAGPNNHLPSEVFIFPFIILLSLMLIQHPNNRNDFEYFNYTEIDTNNNQEENESNYELEFDDFIEDKQDNRQFNNCNIDNNTYKSKYSQIIYLDTPYPPPESV
jgi:hypothetical protein